MEDFAQYNTKLEQVFRLWTEEADKSFLNENTISASAVRKLVSISSLRDSGVFFTNDFLSENAISKLKIPITDASVIIDPTCGSGSLLVAASRKLRVARTASDTLKIWGQQLYGFDIYPEFVRCTKIRIVLEALIRGAVPDKPLEQLSSLLLNIKKGNCLENFSTIKKASHILLNPPYNNSKEVVTYRWATGKISNAAIYFAEIVTKIEKNCAISAILPDVLRSGSRFSAWRGFAEEYLSNASLTVEGKFDKDTDIDIFVLSGITRKTQKEKINWQPQTSIENYQQETVGDYFNVTVGAVVPFRDPHDGPEYSYIHPKILPRWGKILNIPEKRRFSGTTVTPPFVVVRRTSGPRDIQRAVPTLILGKRKVAVENHLIVLKPRDGSLNQCETLLELLNKEHVNNFLNQRIRCRHLTVSAVSEIPWRKP